VRHLHRNAVLRVRQLDTSPSGQEQFTAELSGFRLIRSLTAVATPVPVADGVVPRLPDLCGPDPEPTLLHGDAQQNNFISTASGAVVVDVAPYFGHPEADLALVDIYAPVDPALLRAYAELAPLDPGFAGRRELWRLAGYLAAIAVAGASEFGRVVPPPPRRGGAAIHVTPLHTRPGQTDGRPREAAACRWS
jgi:hypothetical protein